MDYDMNTKLNNNMDDKMNNIVDYLKWIIEKIKIEQHRIKQNEEVKFK